MTELAEFKEKFKPYARHLGFCCRGLPSGLRPCNCGVFELLDAVGEEELEKRRRFPELGPFPNVPRIQAWVLSCER
jgi:hypothetical protein